MRSQAPTLASRIAARFGANARILHSALIDAPRPRSHVWRCELEAADVDSIVVKSMRGFEEPDFDPAARDPAAGFTRLALEYAAARMIGDLADAPLGPRVYGVDPEHGYIVLEDLGDGANLAEILLDPASSTEHATKSLARYAEALARLHATTLGRQHEFRAHANAIAGARQFSTDPSASHGQRVDAWLRQDLPAFTQAFAALDIAPPAQLEAECTAIAHTLTAAQMWKALSNGDYCPDNHIIDRFGQFRLLDFEKGGFRHAFLDLAYLYLPFPTCWCVHSLPDAAVARAEAAYRAQLAPVIPAIADDAIFGEQLAHACAFWVVRSLNMNPDKGYTLAATLHADTTWGRATLRQRHVLRLGNVARLLARHNTLPALTSAFDALARTLRARWGADADTPLFPAFAGTHPGD